jgi:PAS domain S-box-containing protein
MNAEVRANQNPLGSPIEDHEFRKLAAHIPTLCWMADAEGYIFWYNPRWYEYTGTTPEDMQGWGWQSVQDPKTLPEVLDRWKAAISSAVPFEMVFPIKGKDGQFRPFLTRITPAFDQNGVLTNWYGVNTEISRQVDAEAAFAQSEAKFRALAETMPQIVWSATPEGQQDYLNARWYEYTGIPIGSLDPAATAAVIHPTELGDVATAWRGALASGSPFQFECRLRRRDGAYRWHMTRVNPDRAAGGAISKWYGACTDIEEIVQARHVLQKSQAELEAEIAARTGERNMLATLVETTDMLIMAIDLDFKILAINRATAEEMQRINGVTGQVGDNLLDLLAGQPAQQAAAAASWRRAFAGEEGPFIETHGDPGRASGQYEIKFRRLCNAAGETVGAFHIVTDVTERLRQQAMLAQAQEALMQSQKLESMGRLTGGVAHDFNNLLTPILGTLDLLQRRAIGGEREQRLIRGASQSAERAKTLVHRLLAFARRQPLQAKTVDVGQLLEGVADLLSSTAGPAVDVVVEIAEGLPFAKADPHQLEMAILNLGVNARDAMGGIGQMTVTARRAAVGPGEVAGLQPGGYLRLSIADTGQGMDEETKQQAIEPFFSTKGIGQGTGLGLSMVHGLAVQLGGGLTIDSALGAGTTVTIWLPESDEAVEGGEVLPDANESVRLSGAVLLVDDEEHIRVIAAEMLTELGLTVREADSAATALRALDEGLQPDLLITDHLMPGMTGVDLARAVRARLPKTKVLIVSGFAEEEGLDPALPRLTKPFVQGELLAALTGLEIAFTGVSQVRHCDLQR